MNTMTYDVEFPYGRFREYAVNVTTEEIVSHVDNKAFTVQHLFQIIDSSSDDPFVTKSELYCTTKWSNR